MSSWTSDNAWPCFSLNPTNEEIEEVKNDIDEDGNGEIEFHEFLKIMNSSKLRYFCCFYFSHNRNIIIILFVKNKIVIVEILEKCRLWITERAV